MESQIYINLRKLISVVDELRDLGLQKYIDLPRICVVGAQSAGKSSVLEAIVGLDFLPRGEGIVTRRPLELRLVHTATPLTGENEKTRPWAEFDTNREKKYYDFAEVKREIERQTDAIAGKQKGINPEAIVLTVFGPICPDLTIIDLPGIARVPIRGSDQTEDIERVTKEMATKYAQDVRTIILAVVPANQDAATSDALQLARRVDPKGLRTIGVITKIDLMDRGTDAAKMLRGDDFQLRLGYVGVKLRSQKDIQDQVQVDAALEDERRFFSTHPVYRSLPAGNTGTKALTDRLTKVLFRHIKHFLPEIKGEIITKCRSIDSRLMELGEGPPLDSHERVQMMWTVIADYCEIFKNTIRGKYDKRLNVYFEGQELVGGAQVRQIFNELLQEYVLHPVTDAMTDYDIDLAIRLHEGDSLPGFPSPDTFEYLLLPHLKRIHMPVMECLDRVTATLEVMSTRIADRVFCRFPALAEQVLELSHGILIREKEACRQILENVVSAETGYLFTNDSDYLANHAAMGSIMPTAEPKLAEAVPPPTPSKLQQIQSGASAVLTSAHGAVQSVWPGTAAGGGTDNKPRYSPAFIQEIRERLNGYFSIVIRNVRDTVPKSIGYFLVRSLQDKLQYELYHTLNKQEHLDSLLSEPENIREERKALTTMLETLRKAAIVLSRDPSITALSLDGFDEFYDHDLAFQQGRTAGPPGFVQSPSAPAVVPSQVAVSSSTSVPSPTPQMGQVQKTNAYWNAPMNNQPIGSATPPMSMPGPPTAFHHATENAVPPHASKKTSLFGGTAGEPKKKTSLFG